MDRAPIALFVYRRPSHTARTLAALARNDGAAESDLVIFSDGPRAGDAAAARDVEAVRDVARRASGFRSVRVVERPANVGLARSIIAGVGEVLDAHGRVIVVEDDLVTSRHFLTYMHDALDRYADDTRVVSIHGHLVPTRARLPDTFFLRGADCWGWATWSRGWSLFEEDSGALLRAFRARGRADARAFDFDGAFPYLRMLADQRDGRIDSWAIRWHASAFLAGKLTLYPGRSLVQNIGNDGSGTHKMASHAFDIALDGGPIPVRAIPVVESREGRRAYVRFFRATRRSWLRRAFGRLRRAFASASET